MQIWPERTVRSYTKNTKFIKPLEHWRRCSLQITTNESISEIEIEVEIVEILQILCLIPPRVNPFQYADSEMMVPCMENFPCISRFNLDHSSHFNN